MPDIFRYHRGGFWTSSRKRSLYLGILLVALALIIQIDAGHYSSRHAIAAIPMGDIFLNNLPIINFGFLIVGGAIVFWVFSCVLLAFRPKYLLFGMKAIALFVVVRSFFTNLTYEGIPVGFLPSASNAGYGLYHLVTFQGNLFFSGHTGFPFLMALIFWDNNFLRRFFIAATVIFGAVVLFAHVHYSIDVFSAPFIVYGVFVIATRIFPDDFALFPHKPPTRGA